MFNKNFFLLLIIVPLLSNELIINSTLVDINQNPIYNANIFIENASSLKNGTSTTELGEFTIRASNNDVIVISHIAYETLFIKANIFSGNPTNRFLFFNHWDVVN